MLEAIRRITNNGEQPANQRLVLDRLLNLIQLLKPLDRQVILSISRGHGRGVDR